jgi:hypothetical protein
MPGHEPIGASGEHVNRSYDQAANHVSVSEDARPAFVEAFDAEVSELRRRQGWTIEVAHGTQDAYFAAWIGPLQARLEVPNLASAADFLISLHELALLSEPMWCEVEAGGQLYAHLLPSEWYDAQLASELSAWRRAIRTARRRGVELDDCARHAVISGLGSYWYNAYCYRYNKLKGEHRSRVECRAVKFLESMIWGAEDTSAAMEIFRAEQTLDRFLALSSGWPARY